MNNNQFAILGLVFLLLAGCGILLDEGQNYASRDELSTLERSTQLTTKKTNITVPTENITIVSQTQFDLRKTTPSNPPNPSKTPTSPASPTYTEKSPTQAITPVLSNLIPTETANAAILTAPIQFISPGNSSQVTSPISLKGILSVDSGKTLRIELYSEEGTLLFREVAALPEDLRRGSEINTTIDFEINNSPISGRLVIRVTDEFGRLVDLNSIDLTLLSSGSEIKKPPALPQQVIVIDSPLSGETINGSKVQASGFANLPSGEFIEFQLITEKGRVLGHRLVEVSSPREGLYGKFSVEIPFYVQEPTPVRLVVYSDGEEYSDMKYLSSLEIILIP